MIRISGPETRQLISRCFRPSRQELFLRTPTVGHLLDLAGEAVDQVVVTLYAGPASYTGQDLAEVSCHGSPVIARKATEALVGAGARPAEPGEFTLRAFLNGKMDLAQAEAVRDLIESQTEFQAKVAAEQLEGRVSRALEPVKEEIIRILCHMETALEFVEDEVEPETREQMIEALEAVDQNLAQLAETFRWGRMIQEGAAVAIAGKTNVGKSSLFNALLAEERAIVTEIPGTTRDAVTETIDLGGILTRLADTAGIREADHPVERLGVKKSLEYIKQADAVLFVVDAGSAFDEQDRRIWNLIRDRPCVLVLNKEDLPRTLTVPNEVGSACVASVSISALQRTHLDDLKRALLGVFAADAPEREGVLITHIRHRRCIDLARRHLQDGTSSYRSGMSEEFPSYDFRKALEALGQITGETSTEEILQQIFSTFCIGK